MGFWEGERCEYCNGEIIDKKADLSKTFEENMFLSKMCKPVSVRNVKHDTLRRMC